MTNLETPGRAVVSELKGPLFAGVPQDNRFGNRPRDAVTITFDRKATPSGEVQRPYGDDRVTTGRDTCDGYFGER
jgi:hypothetical protein